MKKLLLVLLTYSASNFVFTQEVEFNHSAGATILVGNYYYKNNNTTESNLAGYPGITYNPRIDFTLGREKSISITTYPTLSANITKTTNSNGYSGSSGYFAFEIPTGVQFNIGNHSTSRSRSDFGGFFMAGYTFGVYSDIGRYNSITGMIGAKFTFRDEPIGIRFQYNLPLNLESGEKFQLFGLGILFNFD